MLDEDVKEKKKAKKGKAEAKASEASFPMFYENVEILNTNMHEDLRLRPAEHLKFAASANAIILSAFEIPQAASSYPVVFSGEGDSLTAFAVTGSQEGKNSCVDADGKWKDGLYIPAYVRRYPFIVVEGQESDDVMLAVDPSSDMLNTKEGELIYENKEPTDVAKGALRYCLAYKRDLENSAPVFKQIEEMGLLVERSANVQLPDGETTSLTGFKVIDEEKFNALSDEQFIELRKSKALTMIYCQLWSMRSWKNILD